MDPLSITSSILAILQALSSGIEIANRIWKAPDELNELASELEQLNTLVTILAALTRGRAFNQVDLHTFEAVYARLQLAGDMFEARLSKKSGMGSSRVRFRRRSWIKNASHVKSLTRELATIRKDLLATMLLLTL